ncbi:MULTISPECIES: DUF488 domain-containing protein [Klebsiella pneumoniae complex]|uniref:DUF488 domain-containing protein n=1 Tax=Klebsiella pneumoniae complex TaxID=3390273 RepID=UPI000E2C84D3|nr:MULTISPECIES: DUF488 domain-containing protein [Klebsiella]SYT72905.1 Uncharacterized conserved protein [Klebsiella pneumoniae]
MNTQNQTIFSIGHGARRLEEFIALLKKYHIRYVIDVRSKPRSRFHPHFNREALTLHLKEVGIRYVFMGEQLGGIPKDEQCYDEDGRVDYEKIKHKSFFHEGIERIKTAYSKNLKVVCMCSELSPCDCHRSKLIGDYLQSLGIEMQHINKKGDIISQNDVMKEVLGSNGELDLFSENTRKLKSRKSYR